MVGPKTTYWWHLNSCKFSLLIHAQFSFHTVEEWAVIECMKQKYMKQKAPEVQWLNEWVILRYINQTATAYRRPVFFNGIVNWRRTEHFSILSLLVAGVLVAVRLCGCAIGRSWSIVTALAVATCRQSPQPTDRLAQSLSPVTRFASHHFLAQVNSQVDFSQHHSSPLVSADRHGRGSHLAWTHDRGS